MALSFSGIGASILGADVIGGPTVIFDGSISGVCETTIAVPTQTATGTTLVGGTSAVSIAVPTQTATFVVEVAGAVAQTVVAPAQTATSTVRVEGAHSATIPVPTQTFEGTSAYYVAASQTLSAPTQTAEGTVANNGQSVLAAGYQIQNKPTIGAHAIGDEMEAPASSQIAQAMVRIATTATATNPVAGAGSWTIPAPTLDGNLRPIVAGTSSTSIGLTTAAGEGDVDVGTTTTSTIVVPTQTATSTIEVAFSAGNQQVAGATNVATGVVRVGVSVESTIPPPTNALAGGPVVNAQHAASIAVPTQAATFEVYWPAVANQAIAVPTQAAAFVVEVSSATSQTTAVTDLPAPIGAYAIGDEATSYDDRIRPSMPLVTNAASATVLLLGEGAVTIAAPTNATVGGPVAAAASIVTIDIPTQTATGQVFYKLQADQTIAVPTQTADVDVDVAGQSAITIELQPTATGDVDFTAQSAVVIDLQSQRARAQHYRPAARFRARRYGGTSYPQPTENGYLSWLSQWAS